jgi:hypothetical protein
VKLLITTMKVPRIALKLPATVIKFPTATLNLISVVVKFSTSITKLPTLYRHIRGPPTTRSHGRMVAMHLLRQGLDFFASATLELSSAS